MKKVFRLSIFVALFIVLSVNVLSMPGDIGLDAPSYNDATAHYLQKSVEETGAINVIAAILTDYRAFDTLGETIVLFTSIVAVVSILRPAKKEPDKEVSTHG